jgi:uncharacterized protein Smg (DUF494 family)
MQKRILEIVLYILDRADEGILGEENDAEALKTLLKDAGFDRNDIVRALRLTLDRNSNDEVDDDLTEDESVNSATLSREAWDYLERLRQFGLISEEESGEVLYRAADLPSEDVDLESIRFLAASIIFDRSVVFADDISGGTRIH